jgi:hypothetical protein
MARAKCFWHTDSFNLKLFQNQRTVGPGYVQSLKKTISFHIRTDKGPRFYGWLFEKINELRIVVIIYQNPVFWFLVRTIAMNPKNRPDNRMFLCLNYHPTLVLISNLQISNTNQFWGQKHGLLHELLFFFFPGGVNFMT